MISLTFETFYTAGKDRRRMATQKDEIGKLEVPQKNNKKRKQNKIVKY